MPDDLDQVRCQLCGEDNPAERETCQNCGARLKPLSGKDLNEVSATPDNDLPAPASEDGVVDEKLPEWLQSFRDAPENESAVEEGESEPLLGKDEIPEWLRSLQPRDSPQSEAESEPSSQPEWQREFEPIEAEGEESPQTQETVPTQLPDEAASVPETEQPSASIDLSAGRIDEFEDEEIPDWLKSLPGQVFEEWVEPGEPGEFPLISEEPKPPLPVKPAPVESDEPPDWLAEISRNIEEVTGTGLPESRQPDLPVSEEPAKELIEQPEQPEQPVLPPPVARMEEKIERAGPLYGLRGALPAEPEIARQKKLAASTQILTVNERQQNLANILSEVIHLEGQPRSIPAQIPITPRQMLRVVIFILLALTISLAFFVTPGSLLGSGYSPEIFDTVQSINTLPENSSVLVVVDFEPGYAIEMQAASNALLEQLLHKGAFLLLVSTNTSGPLQAEELLAETKPQGFSPEQIASQYANLGFIPGGASGIQAFALDPRLSNPLDLNGNPVWDKPQLQNIHSLRDLSRVIVITENSDKARTWIEQLKNILDPSQLIMVVSSQAEPVVRAYYESVPKGMQGLLAGLSGGVGFENSANQPGMANTLWWPYSVGIITSVVLILLVGGLNLVVSQFTRSKK